MDKESLNFSNLEQSGEAENRPSILDKWARVRRNPNDENYEKFREQYLATIEAKYHEFINSYGQVAPKNLQEFLVLQSQYVDFLIEHKGEGDLPNDYDMGYRFLVDALLNYEPQLSTEEIAEFRELFEQSAPYYNNYGRVPIEVRFGETHSDDRYKEITKYFIKKAYKQLDVSKGQQLTEDEHKQYYRADDSIWNPSLNGSLMHVLSQMEGMRTNEGVLRDFDAYADLEGKIYSEARKELRDELHP